MSSPSANLWTWRGRVGRTKYLVTGVSLFALKHLIDRIVATQVFGLRWSLFNYWITNETTGIDDVPFGRLKFYATLVAIALPFIWIGVVLTLRRLRDAGLPLWLVVAFFFPFLNLLFFMLLSAMPSQARTAERLRASAVSAFVDRLIPRGSFGSAVLGVVITTLLAISITILSVYGLANYGWGLFVGLPFFLGLSAVLVHGYHSPRSLGQCLLVSLLSVGLASMALIAIAIEGVICVFMALPLGTTMAVFGGVMGYIIQRRGDRAVQELSLHAFSVLLLGLPALMTLERVLQPQAPLRMITTSVEINAPPEVVWRHLVAFAELPPPREWLFRTGIAYPIRAEIIGEGVGAVRKCIFSTGAFVEPIEVWDEPSLLRFGVRSQPPVMEELSPFSDLRPPHLEHYLQSRRGQFSLVRLPGGKTLLEGSTWYQNSFWPSAYWNLWSDYIIHRIHGRVLQRIKHLAER